MGEPLRIGIIGLGTISAQYLHTLDRLESVELVAVADLDHSLAQAVAEERTGVRACGVAQLLAATDVELVLNLTIPAAHAGIALQAISAGKHVYGEKPLGLNTAEGQEVLTSAAAAGVLIGCAPDTVLGTGIQTARKAIDDNLIGLPIAATATMMVPGMNGGTPTRTSTISPAAGRCWTWVPTTCLPWSLCSVR
jgi:predicted dehydrogenase